MKRQLTEVDADLLSKLISNDSNRNQKKDWSQENHEYYSINEKNSFQYDYESYIRRLRKLSMEENFDSNIDFHQLVEPEIIEENNYKYLVKYRITIRNMIVKCRRNQFIIHGLGMDEMIVEGSVLSKDQYKGGIYLCFENVLFEPLVPDKNSHIVVSLGDDCRTHFESCVFDDVDLYFKADGKNIFAHFVKNKFLNRHTTLNGAANYETERGYSSNNYRIKAESQSKIYAANRLCEFVYQNEMKDDVYSKLAIETMNKIESGDDINQNDVLAYFIDQDRRVKIDSNDVEYAGNKSVIISLRDNIVSELKIGGKSFYLIGKNKIDKITMNSSPEHIYYGPYNELDKLGVNARSHKSILIYWKEYALRSKDKSQELILNREIMKAERHLLRFEKTSSCFPFDPSSKDRFILWFNEFSSDFGTNWFRPVYIIMTLNLIFVAVLFGGLGYSLNTSLPVILDTIGMYFELVLPTKSVADVLKVEDLNRGWEALNIVKNIIASAFLYQMVVAFRKYGSK
ncbi:hypothetical protein [Cognaticolwellia mytili]|uniref:hypothetical protein n=1 Tax=Cognaticolwellia mytili TaxID=1888913 RepID=UPI00117FC4A0|nr:hypothetical protein [Cognaticolwellia mytili]